MSQPGKKAMDTLLLYDTACPESLHKKIAHLIGSEGITFSSDVLDARHIRPCAGCFKCWIKTPGECHLTRDGTNALSAHFVRSRTAILLTRVTWGGYSADTKAFIDRCIPHLSPFFATLHGEMHHASRYRHYPDWIVIGYQAVNVSEQETFLQLIQRNAINFFAPKAAGLCLTGDILDTENAARFSRLLRGENV